MASLELRNPDISLVLDTKGAQWVKLLAFSANVSCLWSGEPNVWPRQAPLLFPIVGKLKNDSFLWEGNSFSMSQHGFARDNEFQVEGKTAEKIILSLKSPGSGFFPFDYSLQVTYELVRNSLVSTYKVFNPSNIAELPFSIGAHPGFSYGWLDKGEFWKDVEIEFQNEQAEFLLLEEGLLSNLETAPARIEDGKLALSEKAFSAGALILGSVQSKSVIMKAKNSARSIRMSWDDATAFGLWSKQIDKFICLEPWWGLPDAIDASGDLRHKPALKFLAPGSSWQTQWTLEFCE